MSKSKRLCILLQPEIDDLYSPPRYTIEQQRYFFSLNYKELAVAKSIRKREHRCYFVAMLGYFKTKPVVLNPNFRLIESDLSFVAKETFPGNKLRRLSLNQKQRDRLYEKLFSLNQFKRWKEREHELAKELRVHEYLAPKVKEVGHIVKALMLSQKNQQHFSSMIDYYKSKIKRVNQPQQLLYLWCYFQQRYESNLERIADGFIYHLRKLKDQANGEIQTINKHLISKKKNLI